MIVFKGIHKMSARKWDLQFVRFAFAFGVVFLPGFSLCPLNQFIYKAKHNSQTNIPPPPPTLLLRKHSIRIVLERLVEIYGIH